MTTTLSYITIRSLSLKTDNPQFSQKFRLELGNVVASVPRIPTKLTGFTSAQLQQIVALQSQQLLKRLKSQPRPLIENYQLFNRLLLPVLTSVRTANFFSELVRKSVRKSLKFPFQVGAKRTERT